MVSKSPPSVQRANLFGAHNKTEEKSPLATQPRAASHVPICLQTISPLRSSRGQTPQNLQRTFRSFRPNHPATLSIDHVTTTLPEIIAAGWPRWMVPTCFVSTRWCQPSCAIHVAMVRKVPPLKCEKNVITCHNPIQNNPPLIQRMCAYGIVLQKKKNQPMCSFPTLVHQKHMHQ